MKISTFLKIIQLVSKLPRYKSIIIILQLCELTEWGLAPLLIPAQLGCVHKWSQGFHNSSIFHYPPIFKALVIQRKQQQDLIVFEVFFLGGG
jgi:hypothetical protein